MFTFIKIIDTLSRVRRIDRKHFSYKILLTKIIKNLTICSEDVNTIKATSLYKRETYPNLDPVFKCISSYIQTIGWIHTVSINLLYRKLFLRYSLSILIQCVRENKWILEFLV